MCPCEHGKHCHLTAPAALLAGLSPGVYAASFTLNILAANGLYMYHMHELALQLYAHWGSRRPRRSHTVHQVKSANMQTWQCGCYGMSSTLSCCPSTGNGVPREGCSEQSCTQ